VTFQGLAETMSAVARPSQVDVILSGPMPRLQALTLEDVKVIADLFGLGVGTHLVKPTIVVPESLSVESVLPETVEVQISLLRPTPTVVPTAAATGAPVPTLVAPTGSPAPAPTATVSYTPAAALTSPAPVTDTVNLPRAEPTKP
jgi:hypothetical protein